MMFRRGSPQPTPDGLSTASFLETPAPNPKVLASATLSSASFAPSPLPSAPPPAAAEAKRDLSSVVEGNRVRCVAPQAPVGVDTVELVRLYNAITEATGKRTGTITQFVGGSPGDSMEIAYSAAWIGAALLGNRVLFIDASMGIGQRRLPPIRTSKPLRDVALGRSGVEEALVRQADLPLFLATLQHEKLHGNSVMAAREINGLLEQLRHSFDMIIIAPPPALEQPLAAILTAFVDGSVLVVEAGASGARASAHTLDLLRSGGSPVLGAVLSRRKNVFPRWLRRWL